MAMINLSYFFISCSFFILFLHINSSLAALPTENDSGHYWNHNGLDECYSCYQLEPASWELQECLGQCSHLYKPTSFTPSLPTKDDWNQNGQACMMCGRLPPGAQEACMALCSHLYAQTTSSTPPSLPTTTKDFNQNGDQCPLCYSLKDPNKVAACLHRCSHLYGRKMLILSVPTKE